MIDRIQSCGKLIHACGLPGETRAEGVAPAHPNGMQLSRDRFLLLNATLGFTGVDDSRSTTWQLRQGAYDGPVIKEGFFCQSVNDWDPLDLGAAWKRETGAMTGFGVPKGAVIQGAVPEHANRFVVKWRVCPRRYVADGPEGDYVKWWTAGHEPYVRCYRTGWAQFRLTEDENDLVITEYRDEMRQASYDDTPPFMGDFCEDAELINMNQSYAAVWPFNADHTEWIDIHHANWIGGGGGQLMAMLYRFNPKRDQYEWVRTGRRLGENLFEGSILPWQGDWVIVGRRQGAGGLAWTRLHDPFSEKPRWTFPDDVRSTGTPVAAFIGPDGKVRALTGDASRSPHATDPSRWRDHRNPLFMFEIDPDHDFRMTDCQTVFDIVAEQLPIPDEHARVVDMGKLLPHAGGTEQVVVYRVRSSSMIRWEPGVPERFGQRLYRMTDEIFDACAIYYGKVHYREAQPAMWTFA